MKRRSQLLQFLERKGFVCFLLYKDFIDYAEGYDVRTTDLAKLFLPNDVRHTSTNSDLTIWNIYRSEFEAFLKNYGNVRTTFSYYSDYESRIRKICTTYNKSVAGFVLFNSRYFVPCRLPSEDETKEFFTKIAEALISTSKKLMQDLPNWADDYKFPPEEELLRNEEGLQKQLGEIYDQKEVWKGYKRCLCYDGELLVDSVVGVLKEGLGLRLDEKSDEKIEDKVLIDADGKEIVLVEIKGTNENVKSPNIYQADSHRGRRDKPPDFPSILIMNTFIKSSNSIEEKLREINSEQVRLAVMKKVLIMRTIDLLNLLHLKEQGKIDKDTVDNIFKQHIGWLSVSQDSYDIKEEYVLKLSNRPVAEP